MRRREFITALGGAAMWPVVARGQQPVPVVGLLRSTPAAPFAGVVRALKEGLAETGYLEGRNVVIEQRWADNKPDRLTELAAELVRLGVGVIVGNQQAVAAVNALTSTIPIVFVTGEDPVKAGLVASMSRPGGNLTGVTFFGGSQLNAKRIELLHEIVPSVTLIGVLGDKNYPSFETELPDVEAAARVVGWQTVVKRVAVPGDLEDAFAQMGKSGAGALLVSGSPFFTSERTAVVELAARHKLPAIYDLRNLVAVGGLISYSSSFNGAYHQAGGYAGQILKGARPADLPVQQATVFELAINLKTARALGITVPPQLIARADEVIE